MYVCVCFHVQVTIVVTKFCGYWLGQELFEGSLHDQVQKSSQYNQKAEKTITKCPRGVMVKAMDCGIVVREFVLQSRYYVHFRANTLGKGMNSLIPLAMG